MKSSNSGPVRPRKVSAEAIDYLLVAFSPALIIGMISCLIFFLLTTLYQGPFLIRLSYILFLYTFGVVLIARIAIEQGRALAMGYMCAMGAAATFVTVRFVTFSDGMQGLSFPLVIAFLVLIAFLADRITYDCTIIEDNEDTSGEGLLQSLGVFKKSLSQGKAKATLDSREREQPQSQVAPVTPKNARRRSAGHNPWVWVVYFALLAIPIFGLGQLVRHSDGYASKSAGFWLLFGYLAFALALLVVTNFLSLRRYLRKRRVQMTRQLAATWLSFGLIGLMGMLVMLMLLPLPGRTFGLFGLPFKMTSEKMTSSRWGWGPEGVPDKAGSAPAQPNQQAKSADQGSGNQGKERPQLAKGGSGENQSKSNSPNHPSPSNNPSEGSKDSSNSANQGSEQSSSGRQQSPTHQSSPSQQQPSNQQSANRQQSTNQQQSANQQPSSGQKSNNQTSNNQSASSKQPAPDQQVKSSQNQSGNQSSNQSNSNPRNSRQADPDSNSEKSRTSTESSSRDEGTSEKGRRNEGSGSDKGRKSESLERNPTDREPNDRNNGNRESQRNESDKQQESKTSDKGSEQKSQSGQQSGQNQSSSKSGTTWQPQLPPIASLFKWLTIAGLLVFLFFYAIRFRSELLAWIAGWKTRLSGNDDLKHIGSKADRETVDSNIRSFSSFVNPFEESSMASKPSQIVPYLFEAVQAWGREHDLPQLLDETPEEFLKRLGKKFQSQERGFRILAQQYYRLAYGKRELTMEGIHELRGFAKWLWQTRPGVHAA